MENILQEQTLFIRSRKTDNIETFFKNVKFEDVF